MTWEFSGAWSLAWTQLWQVTVVIAVAAIITRLCCRDRPHLAYLLWLIVLLKCWVPPLWSSPSGVFCWFRGAPSAAALPTAPPTANVEKQRFAVDGSAALAAKQPAESPQRSHNHQPREQSVSLRTAPIEASTLAVPIASHWPFALGAIWLAGVMTLVAITWLRWLAWRRRVQISAEPPDAILEAMIADMAARVQLRRPVNVLVTSAAIGPAVFGIVRPTLVFPRVLLRGKDLKQIESIIAHELVHVRRGDLLVGWLQLATQFTWWFHPLVWRAGLQLARERERCCDEEVVASLRCDPAAYAQSLLDVLKLRRRLRPMLACPGIRPVEVTARRIEHIVRYGDRARSRAPWTYWLAAAALFCLLAPGAALHTTGFAAQGNGDHDGTPQPVQVATQTTRLQDRDKQQAADPQPADPQPADEKNQSAAQAETAAKISQAVDRAAAYLKQHQFQNGDWPDPVGYPGGITALCTLALLRSGVAANDPAIVRAREFLRRLEPSMTYSTALITLVFCETGDESELRIINRNVRWFTKQQKVAGVMQGAWAYPQAEGDNSNTGFAMMALHGALRAGVPVEEKVWRRASKYWLSAQNPNGSWGYKPGLPGTGSMTCEGMFSVAAAAKALDDPNQTEAARKALAGAQQWLAEDFSVAENRGTHSAQGWIFYYRFALAEAARLNEIDAFGEHDWYREGAEQLLREQQQDGSWVGKGHAEDHPHVATSFALLFLRAADARKK